MAEKILMKGNEAMAEAAIQAGCRHFFGYPITPQTEVAAYMAKHMVKVGGTYLQAESEIAAVNMVLGAASTGVRAMTSSSSPGVSLKTEGISYLAGSDVPALIVNVQRGGPGLGSIQPAQSDYFQATKAAGHGDFNLIVLAPASVQEMADFVRLGFDLGDKYRVPVMLLADGMLGQTMEPVSLEWDEEALPEKPWAACGHNMEREHNIINSLYMEAHDLEEVLIDRYKRYDVIKGAEQRSESYLMDDAEFCIVAYGASSRVARSAIDMARSEGIKVGMIRPITLWPFPVDVLKESVPQIEKYLVVEMSMGQMIEDVRLAIECQKPVQFFGRTGGVIPSPQEVYAEIKAMAGGAK